MTLEYAKPRRRKDYTHFIWLALCLSLGLTWLLALSWLEVQLGHAARARQIAGHLVNSLFEQRFELSTKAIVISGISGQLILAGVCGYRGWRHGWFRYHGMALLFFGFAALGHFVVCSCVMA